MSTKKSRNFTSLTEASQELGLSVQTLRYRRDHGIPLDCDTKLRFIATVDGEELTLTYKEWAEELGLTYRKTYDQHRYEMLHRESNPDKAMQAVVDRWLEA